VLPSYFNSEPGPWSHGNNLSGPCPTLAEGGYQSIYVAGQWTQVMSRMGNGEFAYRALRRGRSFRRAGGKRMISEGSGEVQDNVKDDPGFSWIIAAFLIAFFVGWSYHGSCMANAAAID
jgi:hypothetical protein